MRLLLASLLLLGALFGGAADASRWEQRQPLFAADRGERRPLFQRRQAEPPESPREAPRFEPPATPGPNPQASQTESMPRAALQPAEAGRRAQQQYGGRVLSVAPADSGYHVRLLRNGEVSVVTVPNP